MSRSALRLPTRLSRRLGVLFLCTAAGSALRSAPPPGEVLLLHFREEASGMALEGAMISPGTARFPRRLPPAGSWDVELLTASGDVLQTTVVPDPRLVLAARIAGDVRPLREPSRFSLRVPWREGSRGVRILTLDRTVLVEVELTAGAVRIARERHRALQERLSREAARLRPVSPRRPSGPVPPDHEFPTDPESRAAADAMLEEAKRAVRERRFAEDPPRAAATLQVSVTNPAGEPVVKAGVIAIDPATGRSMGGAETSAGGLASISATAPRAKLYIFPPYTAGQSPFARRILDVDVPAQGTVGVPLVLDGGVRISGTVARAASGTNRSIQVTAVDAESNAAVEYATTDAGGSFGMSVPPGRYRFHVGGQPGWETLIADVGELSPPSADFSWTLRPVPLTPISGTVVGEAGEPLARIRLAVYDDAANSYASLTTGHDGTFAGEVPAGGFLFVTPPSGTRDQAVTRLIAGQDRMKIVLPEVPEIRTPDAARPQLGLVHGDAEDAARINLVFVGDGYTDIEEPFTDSNGNGIWDGDIYLDENRNGRYDSGEQYYNRNGVAGYQPPEPFDDVNGDGYRNSGEQALLDRNVLDYVRVMLGTSPWPDLLDRINIWRIRVVSRQAGGDIPEFGIVRDTALGTTYGNKATGFIVSVSSLAVTELVQAYVPGYDHIVSISNSPLAVGRANANFGGNLRLRGGDFDNLSTVATHELGHSVGLLSDEYSDQTVVETRWVYRGTEPGGPNVTTIPIAGLSKWSAELDGTSPCPTPPGTAGAGLFEGASTYFRGIYRPEYNCMMRFNTPRFCVICNREMRAQIIDRSSTHSLVFPLLIFNLAGAAADRLQSAFSVMNPDPEKELFLAWTATNETGRLVTGRGVRNPAVRRLGPLGQDASFERELFGPLASGQAWVELNTNGPAKGFYLVSDPLFADKVDGGPADPDTSTDLALPWVDRTDGSAFSFCVVNPSDRTTMVTVTRLDPAGRTVSEETRSIPSKGHAVFGAPEQFKGWVRIRSSAGAQVCAAGLADDSRSLSVESGSSLTAEAPFLCFPHWAVGGGYETRMALATTAPVRLRFTAFRNDGTQAAASVERSFAALEQLDVSVRDFFGLDPGAGIDVGYIVAAPVSAQSAPLKGVAGLCRFTFSRDSAAVSPAERLPRRQLTFAHVANDVAAGRGRLFQTGLTLINPGTREARFTVAVFADDGTRLREREIALPAGGKVSRLLSGDPASDAFFAKPLVAASGYIVAVSDEPLFGFELFFTGDLALMAAVPAQ